MADSNIPKLIKKPRPRSNRDLSYTNSTTLAPMVITPVYGEEVIPADRFKISTSFALDSMPMTNPFRGQMKVRLDFFFVPLRIYAPQLRSNNVTYTYEESATSSGADFKLPTVTIPRSSDENNPGILEASALGRYIHNNAVHPGSLLDHLRYPFGYVNTAVNMKNGKSFYALPLLGYWDIVRNYYVNPQEEFLYVIGASSGSDSVDGHQSLVNWWHLSDLNSLFINQTDFTKVANKLVGWNDSMNALDSFGPFVNSHTVSQGGMALRTYLPDYFSNYIGLESYQNILSNQSLITVVDGNVSVQQVTMSTRLTRMAEDYLAGGGRISEYIRSTFCVRPDSSLDIPQLIGSITTTFDFKTISNTAGTSSTVDEVVANQRMFLGGAAARGGSYVKDRTLYFESGGEYGYILGLASICPIPDYAGGTPKVLERRYFSDIYDPHMDRVGYEPIRQSQYYDGAYVDPAESLGLVNYDNFKPEDVSLAYQPAFMEYLTRYNEVHGEYLSTLSQWSLFRDFARSRNNSTVGNIGNPWKNMISGVLPPTNGITPTTYGLPSQQYYPFVDTSRLAPNIVGTFYFDVSCKRTKSKQLSPVLEQLV